MNIHGESFLIEWQYRNGIGLYVCDLTNSAVFIGIGRVRIGFWYKMNQPGWYCTVYRQHGWLGRVWRFSISILNENPR